MKVVRRILRAIVWLSLLPSCGWAADPLQDGFIDPPNSARPRVWWHWMNGNVTQEGIAKDLDWMARMGIGGLQNFDANLTTPTIVEKRLAYMTPEWREAFRFAASQAQEKGLELAIATSPGWSETGGPWVKAEDAMKKLVWSETVVRGGKRFSGKLPQPPRTAGPYQDIQVEDSSSLMRDGTSMRPPEHYADVVVLAYPVPRTSTAISRPRMISSDGQAVDTSALIDDSLSTSIAMKRGTRDAPASLTIEYDEPRTIRSATLFTPGAESAVAPRLEALDGGGQWRKVVDITLSAVPTTVSFAPQTAKKFRVVFVPAPPKDFSRSFAPAPGFDGSFLAQRMAKPPQGLQIAELRLSSAAVVDKFEIKAGFAVADDYYALGTDIGAEVDGIAPSEVLNLSDRLQADGSLDWTPPKGDGPKSDWIIVRLGWSLTGKMNHPATDEATGLEVDKMDGDAVRRYLEQYLQRYEDAIGPDLLGDKGVRALLSDSTEVGAFNWTPRMIEQFKRQRGYDPTPWLLTVAGKLVGSRQQSDAFLYDFRRTIADLHATEHYGTIAKVAHERGLKVYGEALESQRPSLGDDLAMRSFADYPMAAMWTYAPRFGPRSGYRADMKGASSVAHLYGQNIAAAESMTSVVMPWAHAPSDLRRVIDLEFAHGINRPVIHTSVHQPLDDKVPGLSLSVFGQYFNRHESWAELARPWIDYIARSSYLLQQGIDVADVAYFYGEEAPLAGLYKDQVAADLPVRYAYDFVNSDALMSLLTVDNGDLVAKSGARYKVLYLGGSSRFMTLPTLRQVAQLVGAGATVVGNAPQASPSLKDDRPEFVSIVSRLWGSAAETRVGKGRVIAGTNVEAALASIGASPDLEYTKTDGESEVLFVHRKLADGDLYFVNNRRNTALTTEVRFRVSGKQPEIWRADTATVEPVSYRIQGQNTIIPLQFAAEDSCFVVFRKPASATSMDVPQPAVKVITQLGGPWDVSFEPGRGAPGSLRIEQLASLSEHSDAGIKYFSGVATYAKQFTLPRAAKRGSNLVLDLGQVGDLAEVRLNGERVGTVWHSPYRIDIGAYAKPGKNELEIRVANLWVNRLIGDAQPGANKITWTASPTYAATAPLRPSGLIGPVQVLAEQWHGPRMSVQAGGSISEQHGDL